MTRKELIRLLGEIESSIHRVMTFLLDGKTVLAYQKLGELREDMQDKLREIIEK